MWTVAKVKKNQINTFKKNLSDLLDKNIKFYMPKIEYTKYFKDKVKKFDKPILENYIFCYHEKFYDSTNINKLKFTKGLEYFIEGHYENQQEIIRFIDYCKSFENKEGYITSAFFKSLVSKKAKFVSGPFVNMMFEIIERQKNKLKILVGNIVTTISDKKNYLYRPV